MNTLRFRFLIFFVIVTSSAWSQKIGLLMDSYVIDRWYKDEKFFIEKVKALGGEVVQEVPHGDADEQIKLNYLVDVSQVEIVYWRHADMP